MLLLNRDALTKALPMRSAIDAMNWAYRAWSTGLACVPTRIHIDLPDGAGVTLVMPAYVAAEASGSPAASLVVKTVSVCPGNAARSIPVILGVVQVIDARDGSLLALIDGATLTAIRTGAGSGAATDVLARPDAKTLAILGAGVQARTQLVSVCCVRKIERIRIYSRTRARAEVMLQEVVDHPGVPLDIHVVDTPAAAVRDADIICTATTSSTPTFDDADLKNGVHINAVGVFKPTMAEIPAMTISRASVFVDQLESAMREAGDVIMAIRAGLFHESEIRGEIGGVLAGTLAGRLDNEEITVFKSVGMAAQDAIAASVALANAKALGLGQEIEWC